MDSYELSILLEFYCFSIEFYNGSMVFDGVSKITENVIKKL